MGFLGCFRLEDIGLLLSRVRESAVCSATDLHEVARRKCAHSCIREYG